ncbi:hypothetical protein [Amycolatopsis sp. FDAARGOS 1241]|uniref:hypothetical protein n=1 Tax=Amycolatopsis sp. FDAARGOS 1241 TaxID=2778070 RepID=UPI001EF1D89F|nr:hypothetical protein [Amycolatopsis sp. FDAARGOS 1241]
MIRGVGLSDDGTVKGGMLPQEHGQLPALRRAYRDAGVEPGSVGYLEAHGAATSVGDDVEINALGELRRDATEPAYLGAAKSVVGHSFGTAGIAGLIKSVHPSTRDRFCRSRTSNRRGASHDAADAVTKLVTASVAPESEMTGEPAPETYACVVAPGAEEPAPDLPLLELARRAVTGAGLRARVRAEAAVRATAGLPDPAPPARRGGWSAGPAPPARRFGWSVLSGAVCRLIRCRSVWSGAVCRLIQWRPA